jgi:hypothetical protein
VGCGQAETDIHGDAAATQPPPLPCSCFLLPRAPLLNLLLSPAARRLPKMRPSAAPVAAGGADEPCGFEAPPEVGESAPADAAGLER